MHLRRNAIAAGITLLFLGVLGVSQLQAQGTVTLTSLSQQMDKLIYRVSTLERTRANNARVQKLENRIATLEARLGDARLPPTATRKSPTSTPTPRPPTATPTTSPTATPTPETPYITTTRPMNIRSGPGTNYDVVGYATDGEKLIVTGKNSAGNWWRIEFKGQDAWIYAFYVTETNTDGIRAVPTPAPPSPTPAPTATPQAQFELYELAYFVITLDQKSIGRGDSWENTSAAEQAEVVDVMGKFLLVTSDYCDLSVYEMTELIYKYGAIVDESGYSLRNEYAPRTNLLYELIQYAEDNPRRNSCDQLMEWRVILLLGE